MEREEERMVKVGYKKINIDRKQYMWIEEVGELKKKKNF